MSTAGFGADAASFATASFITAIASATEQCSLSTNSAHLSN